MTPEPMVAEPFPPKRKWKHRCVAHDCRMYQDDTGWLHCPKCEAATDAP
jgi:hypothetical protein